MVQIHPQQALDLEQRRIATHQQFARLVGEDAALGLAVFVLNVAHQHFQHVFHGQVADHLAVGFFDQGEVRAALAELLQQVRQRHVARHALQRAGQFGQVERLGDVVQVRQLQQQVLDVQQAEELTALGIQYRVATELVPTEHREDLLQRRIGVQADHVLAGVGPIDHFQFAHFHCRGQHAHALVARVLAAAGVQDEFQFVAAVVVLVVRTGFALAGDSQDGVGAGVEQVDGRVHQPVEQVQRHGSPQRQQFGFANGPGLGCQFADHDVQVGNHEEGAEERHGLDDFR
ncbi:hypothetical protein D3C77_63810 [compost metagenome]